jgi:Cu/Ag efflux pump CusA
MERMKILIPLRLLITVVLLYLQFKNFTEVLIVLLSVPFALVGSVWALWLLDYNVSTAVWVGVIALVGLAAQTGVVMIVYIDHAYERRLREGDQLAGGHHRGALGGNDPARAAEADDGEHDAHGPGAAALGAGSRAPT